MREAKHLEGKKKGGRQIAKRARESRGDKLWATYDRVWSSGTRKARLARLIGPPFAIGSPTNW